MSMLLQLLTELSSRKWVSRCAGAFSKSRFSKRLIPYFVRTYRISHEEAEKALGEYASLNEFFTRRLVPGARPVDPSPDSVASPVDGVVTGFGTIEPDGLFLVKGQTYSLEELLNGSPRARIFRNGFYIVLYLSPKDYHRIHSPVDGTIVERDRIGGKVYPVNEFGLTKMRKVLARNERVVTFIRGRGCDVALVKVGALNVAGIRYVNPDEERVTRGGELAFFEFGSTVVLLVEPGKFEPRGGLAAGQSVRMGESLGKLVDG